MMHGLLLWNVTQTNLKDVNFRGVQLPNDACSKARNGSGGTVDDVDQSTSK